MLPWMAAPPLPRPDKPCPPRPQEFLWEKEGSDTPLQMNSESVLVFPFLNKSDSGTYVCTATSSMGSVIAKYNLDVNGKPWAPPAQPEPAASCPQAGTASRHRAGYMGPRSNLPRVGSQPQACAPARSSRPRPRHACA